MSQDPASSQRSFYSAAEEWNEDIDLSNTPAGDNDSLYDGDPLHDDLFGDDGLLNFEGAPQPLENPPKGSELHTNKYSSYAASMSFYLYVQTSIVGL
jgi:hypothetical protein